MREVRPEGWQGRLLDRASMVLALLAPASLCSALLTRPTTWSEPGPLLFATACVLYAVAFFARALGPQIRSILVVGGSLLIQVAAVSMLGYVVGALGIGFVAVLSAGLFFGSRAGVVTLLISTVAMVSMAVLFSEGVLASPFDPRTVDPVVLGNGLRYSLTFFILGLIVVVGASVLIQRLSLSLEQAEAALRQAEELEKQHLQLQQAIGRSKTLEVLGQLAGGIAHDFNNMLTVILTNAEILKEKPDAGGEIIDELIEASKQSARMTAQLLAFGKDQAEPSVPVRLNSVIESFVPLLRRLIREDRSLELSLEARRDRVLAHKTSLEQIILNLVINADQAFDDAGHIRIATRDGDASGSSSTICLCVQDNGPGIRPELVDKVFEPLFSTKSSGSAGLGLSTVKAAVEQCHGEIVVESELDRGTEFIVHFPVSEAPVVDASPDCSFERATGERTVLVVDDDHRVRASVIRTLKRRGYRTLAASGVVGAEDEFRRASDVDIVLTDVVLSDGSGPDVVERLRMLQPALPALYMTGYTAGILQRKGIPQRDRVVSKPFDAAVLVRAIEDAFRVP